MALYEVIVERIVEVHAGSEADAVAYANTGGGEAVEVGISSVTLLEEDPEPECAWCGGPVRAEDAERGVPYCRQACFDADNSAP